VSIAELEVVIGRDAVERLAAFVAERRRRALVVCDLSTWDAVGERVVKALGVRAASRLVFPVRSGLLAGLEQAEEVRSAAAAIGRPLLIAAGSGVITDIVRYAAGEAELDFVSVPSAASMDGYASSVAAMEIDGVKVTIPARAPMAIFVDPGVAAAAPGELTRAGLGDLLAKATARVDWLAAHLLYGEPFSADVAALVDQPLAFAIAHVEDVLAGGEQATAELLRGLVQSGIAIARNGNSRPASGFEHHASHFWDLLAARGVRDHASHGLQVGYATRFAMRLQRFAFGDGVVQVPTLPVPVGEPLGAAAVEWLGEPTPEIMAAVAEKQRFSASLDQWPRDAVDWEAVRARLAPALSRFDEVSRALDAAGFPDGPGYLGVDGRTLEATFRYASRLRARYTVIDFLEGQRLLDQAVRD
jgi:glycerol-1-phosphate dehydrogenase [NAD(P)+]